MSLTALRDLYLEKLLQGQRQACGELVWQNMEARQEPEAVYHELLWPAMEQVERLFREDRINIAAEHMATRINRCLADQVQRCLQRRQANGKRIIITCADGESPELGAQMCADLFEAHGWQVYFVGGGVPHDELLALIGQLRPEILMVYGMSAGGVPQLRALIDLIREVGVNPSMNVMITGGVFNRAEELWMEINADLYAPDAQQALAVAEAAEPHVPSVKAPGTPKKRRRRRRPPLLAQYESGMLKSA
ncbi:MAG: hypothetical protein HJJLKODD_02604 [Phycisphaerae bacterium]|nr:hypothetical protein [Phycisphaerae bacterium]